jgi:hypothetical protein
VVFKLNRVRALALTRQDTPPGFQHDDLIASTKEKASGLRMPKGGGRYAKKETAKQLTDFSFRRLHLAPPEKNKI